MYTSNFCYHRLRVTVFSYKISSFRNPGDTVTFNILSYTKYKMGSNKSLTICFYNDEINLEWRRIRLKKQLVLLKKAYHHNEFNVSCS